jgi:hypothetical protein
MSYDQPMAARYDLGSELQAADVELEGGLWLLVRRAWVPFSVEDEADSGDVGPLPARRKFLQADEDI